MSIEHRYVESNGIRIHIAEAGAGPLVLLCHGFPELWYSWRHQLTALADAGYHAVAPDMRGYGDTDAPADIAKYSIFHLVGDIVGLVDALGKQSAVVVGHDWGAPVAWHAALIRPDRFRGVVGLSVPYVPHVTGKVPPSALWPRRDDAVFYQQYFQEPGVAEADLQRNVTSTLRRVLVGASGDAEATGAGGRQLGMVPKGGSFADAIPEPQTLPSWLTEEDVAYYAAAFSRTGYAGGLNWYRNIDRNWEQTAAYTGARVTVPALYMVGERDLVKAFRGMDLLLANLKAFIPDLRENIVLSGCGHWTQQERPVEVNAALLRFLGGLSLQ